MKDTNSQQRSFVPASTQLQMRVTPERKARYQQAAQREGLTFTQWAQKHLDEVAK